MASAAEQLAANVNWSAFSKADGVRDVEDWVPRGGGP